MLETILVVLIVFLSAGGILWRSSRRVKNLTRICDDQACSELSIDNSDLCQSQCPLKEIKKRASERARAASSVGSVGSAGSVVAGEEKNRER